MQAQEEAIQEKHIETSTYPVCNGKGCILIANPDIRGPNMYCGICSSCSGSGSKPIDGERKKKTK